MKLFQNLRIVLCSTLILSSIFLINSQVQASLTDISSAPTEDMFSSQLEMPIISITTEEKQEITSNEEYLPSTISILNSTGDYEMKDKTVSIRLRGNSSLHLEKSSYKLKFEKKQNLLNLGKGSGKTWGLIANYYDVSLLRNWTTYQFANSLSGIPYSPDCRSIELYVNGEYEGVYLLCEMVNVNKNRIDIVEEADEIEQNGYLLEMTRYTSEDSFSVDTESYDIKSSLSETTLIQEKQKEYIREYLEECILSLKSNNKEKALKYINIDSLIDIYIVNEIVKNVDTGWDSFYMYKDAGGKLCFGPVWDFDLALGNANCVKGFDSWKGISPYTVLNVNANSNPWFCYALSCDWFRTLVKERYQELQSIIKKVPDSIINEAESNYNSYCRNFEKWDLLGHQVYIEPAQISKLTSFKDHYTYLSTWLKNRINWLTSYYNSTDFINGIFIDDMGEPLTDASNIIGISSILAYAIPPAEMTYTMTNNAGMILDINKGGSASWNIQAIASGFMLEEGAEYEFSFDYCSTKDFSTPFSIQQNHDKYSPYLTDTIDMTNESKHYETTFTATANDTNCAFAISLGDPTLEGAVVTIDHMYLSKKLDTPENPTTSPITTNFEVISKWDSGSICKLTLTNTSEKDITNGWTISFDLPCSILSLWSATIKNDSNGHYIINNPEWKTSLNKGDSYTIYFQVNSSNPFELANLKVQPNSN